MSFSGDRLKACRKALKLTQGELGERVGLSQTAISDLERGATLETNKLLELAKACGVSPEWLQGKDPADRPKLLALPGNHDRFSGDREVQPASFKIAHISDMHMISISELDVRAGAAYGGGMSDEEWRVGNISGDKPIAKWGLPQTFVERELRLAPDKTEILQIYGDSMDDGSDKSLSSGDRVIVDRDDNDIRQGGIFAVYDGEGVIIKQVELIRGHEPPRIVCKSRNTRYDPIPLILESPVRIIGRVAGRISRM